MALVNPCDVTAIAGKNTGVECNSALGVAKGFWLVPATATWAESDMATTSDFFNAYRHSSSVRFYPVLQGIFDFAQAAESDITEANPISGTTDRIRPGGFTLTYTFKDGGMCLAKALKAFEGSGYRVIFVDNNNQFLLRQNASGTSSGLKTNDISSSIIPATGTSRFKNTVVLSVSQDEYINYSKLYKTDEDISDYNGLIETEVYKAAAASTTKLKVGVRTECAHTDLIEDFGSTMADLDLYIITNSLTGVVVTPTAGAVVSGIVELTGTYVSGQTYIVTGSAASVWKTNLVEGYDASVEGKYLVSRHLIP